MRVAVIILLCGLTACLKQKDDTPPPRPPGGEQTVFSWAGIADSASKSLNLFWSASQSVYMNTNSGSDWAQYWPNAHALDVLVDAYLRTGNASYKGSMLTLVNGVRVKNGNTLINYYYDDMEWMALACLRAYEVTNDAEFKNVVDLLWADIKNGWSNDLGGGIWWRKDNGSKNAPSNLPAAILAARLYQKFNNPQDLQWANQIYDWQKSVLYDASSGWVYDNIDKNGNKNLTWKFTYNQGTFVGAALELYKITGSAVYLNDAIKAADYAVSSGFLTANGLLKDEGGGDGGLFKGVFVRYFTRLLVEGGLEASKKTIYLNFMTNNAKTLWTKGTNKTSVLFGSAWDKAPAANTDFTIQLSGIMLMEAMAELKKLNLIN